MKRFGMAALLLVVFIIGCATAVVTQSFIVPPIRANTNPQKWEYYCADLRVYKTAHEVGLKLNQYGKEGWELATTQTSRYCLKRPL